MRLWLTVEVRHDELGKEDLNVSHTQSLPKKEPRRTWKPLFSCPSKFPTGTMASSNETNVVPEAQTPYRHQVSR